MSKLGQYEQEALFRAHQMVQVVITRYRKYPVHPKPHLAGLKNMEALLANMDDSALTGGLESFGAALAMEFVDPERKRTLKLKFLLGDTSKPAASYVLGFDGPQMQQKPGEFTHGCDTYMKEVDHEVTLLILVMKPMDAKVQLAIMAEQPTIGVRVELFSITQEMQLDPFKHVLQSKQEIVSKEFLQEHGIATKILPRELVSYTLASGKKTDGSITAKWLGAKQGDVILHTCRSVAHQSQMYTKQLRLVENAE